MGHKRNWKAESDPELTPLLKELPNVTFGPVVRRIFRFLGPRFLPPFALPDDLTLRKESVGTQSLHIFSPKNLSEPRGALLWIHGGGLIVGNPETYYRLGARLAQSLGIIFAATSYRLAPEHPFPAAIDDCQASWDWLNEHAKELHIDPTRIAIGGDSAGGGLTACLAHRLVDRGGVQPPCQVLVYPMLDDRTAANKALHKQKHLIWNNKSNHYGWSCYLNQEPGSPGISEYAVAARREDLSGQPPTWLTVGEFDLFYEEDKLYVKRLQEANVPTELDDIEKAFHAYFGISNHEPPRLQQTMKSLQDFLRQHLT